MVDKCRFCGRVLGTGHKKGCRFWRHPRPRFLPALLLCVPFLCLFAALAPAEPPSAQEIRDRLAWWQENAPQYTRDRVTVPPDTVSAPPRRIAPPERLIPIALNDDKPAPKTYEKGYKPLAPEVRERLHAERSKAHGGRIAALARAATPPAEFDCKDMGWAGDAGDQSSCGSCFLYSTVKTVSTSFVKNGYGKVDVFRLSFQYGMDCHNFGGCNGGNGTEVIDWMVKNGWPAESYVDATGQTKSDYPPYEARARQCRLPANAKKWYPKDWLFITSDQRDRPATVAEMKAALMAYGRVNVALDAGGQFGSYRSGVITTLGNSIDHEINVRGWSDAKQAFLLENQWAGWGGAKSPGDNCAWLAFSAVGKLVDPFAVIVAPVVPPDPVPPPPPPPPGSKVASYVTITYTDGSTQVLPAPNSITVTKDTTLADILNKLKEVKEGMEPPLVPPTDKSNEDRWRDNDRALKAILDKLDLIDKQLGIKKP